SPCRVPNWFRNGSGTPRREPGWWRGSLASRSQAIAATVPALLAGAGHGRARPAHPIGRGFGLHRASAERQTRESQRETAACAGRYAVQQFPAAAAHLGFPHLQRTGNRSAEPAIGRTQEPSRLSGRDLWILAAQVSGQGRCILLPGFGTHATICLRL